MTPFAYVRAHDRHGAIGELTEPGGRFIAGGTNILDLMKVGVTMPSKLIDINRLGLDAIEATDGGGVRLGALARNADTAHHPLVRDAYPMLSAAILAGASGQIRNRATNGGNLMQRTRCYYFYDVGLPCNKRLPGSGCSAIGGVNRQHAILGVSDACIATHPSDMCVALAALDAVVNVEGRDGARQIPFVDFHRLPGDRPDLDNTLAADELITHLELPPGDRFAAHSTYLKLRERASYAFALVSVAAALELAEDGSIADARLALGAVAHKPWRDPAAEALMRGARPTTETFERVADALLVGAKGQGANDFKVPMARRAVVRALQMACEGKSTNTGLDADDQLDVEDAP